MGFLVEPRRRRPPGRPRPPCSSAGAWRGLARDPASARAAAAAETPATPRASPLRRLVPSCRGAGAGAGAAESRVRRNKGSRPGAAGGAQVSGSPARDRAGCLPVPDPPPARADQLTPSPGKSPAAEGVEHFRGATGLSADASRSLILRRERRSASKMAMGSEAAQKRLRGPPSLHHQQGWPFPGLRQPQHRLPLGIKDLAFPGFISSPSSLPAFFFFWPQGEGGREKGD